jgi:hypothetical protein
MKGSGLLLERNEKKNLVAVVGQQEIPWNENNDHQDNPGVAVGQGVGVKHGVGVGVALIPISEIFSSASHGELIYKHDRHILSRAPLVKLFLSTIRVLRFLRWKYVAQDRLAAWIESNLWLLLITNPIVGIDRISLG